MQQQTITINVLDPASPLAPGTPGGDLPQLGVLDNLLAQHPALIIVVALLLVVGAVALIARKMLLGWGQPVKRNANALLRSSGKVALSLAILAPLVSPLFSAIPPAYAAASLQTNGPNLTIDIVKDADPNPQATVTGTTTATTTVTTNNAVGYTLTAAMSTDSLQALAVNGIKLTLLGAGANFSFTVPDQAERLLRTSVSTPIAGEATSFTITVTVPSTIEVGEYEIGINFAVTDNISRILYETGNEEVISNLADFVEANSKASESSGVIVNSDPIPKAANTIKGVYLYGEVPIRTNFLRSAFAQCVNLVDVDFNLKLNNNDNVVDLSRYFEATFRGCTSLNTSINLPSIPSGMVGVTYLTRYFTAAFDGCRSLNTTINLPAIPSGMTSVLNIDYYFTSTFARCINLSSAINIPAIPSGMTDVTSWGFYYLSNTFYNCPRMTEALISNIPPCDVGSATILAANATEDYAAGTNPVSPDRPIDTMEGLKAGYKYHP